MPLLSLEKISEKGLCFGQKKLYGLFTFFFIMQCLDFPTISFPALFITDVNFIDLSILSVLEHKV
jgi:hypothetical protein